MKALQKSKRGDHGGYLLSVIVVSASLLLLLLLYRSFDPMLIEWWGARSGSFLDTRRPLGAKVWRMLCRGSSSWVCLWLPILWLLSMYLVQSGLTKRNAKVFNKIHIFFIVTLSGLAFLSFTNLLLRPLG